MIVLYLAIDGFDFLRNTGWVTTKYSYAIQHATKFSAGDVADRLADQTGSLMLEKRASVLTEIAHFRALMSGSGNGEFFTNKRLRDEMERAVDAALMRSLDLLSPRERGIIASMMWRRNSTHYHDAISSLPGGRVFFTDDPNLALDDEINFRVETLDTLVKISVEFETFIGFTGRLGASRAECLQHINARACSQDVQTQVVTLYFDNEEHAVYAKCIV